MSSRHTPCFPTQVYFLYKIFKSFFPFPNLIWTHSYDTLVVLRFMSAVGFKLHLLQTQMLVDQNHTGFCHSSICFHDQGESRPTGRGGGGKREKVGKWPQAKEKNDANYRNSISPTIGDFYKDSLELLLHAFCPIYSLCLVTNSTNATLLLHRDLQDRNEKHCKSANSPPAFMHFKKPCT